MSKQDIDRIEYALENPWVLQYDFGHFELIKKYYYASLQQTKI